MDQTTIKVPEGLFASAESSSFAGTYALESLEAGPDIYTFAAPLSWDVLVSNTGGALLVTGSVRGTGQTSCGRCLDPVDVDINGEIEGYFLIEGEETTFEEGEEEEFDILGEDNTIDLIPLIEAAILVELPLMPLCQEDCKGLCPDCGANLNTESCNCAEARAEADAEFEAAKNPFAKLRELDLSSLENN